MLPCRNIKSQI